MKLQITRVQVGVNMGDHAQDVTTAFESIEGETVEQMCERILVRPSYGFPDPHVDRDSYVVIRPVVESGHERCVTGWDCTVYPRSGA